MSESAEVQIFRDSVRSFLEPIWDLYTDPAVTEIMINGPFDIFVERGGKVFKTPNQFPNNEALNAAILNIGQSVKREFNEENPTMDARTPDGFRLHAVRPPCARNGTTVAIRKFSTKQMTFKEYVQLGAITAEAAKFLSICMFLGKNIVVSGGTGSGKTTLLGTLAGLIPKGQRLIVIEDASELKIDYDHVVFFETKMADAFGKGEVTIRDLLKSSLRLRPDRIVVGEVRGAEAMELINAMNTGHKGCLGTVHANSPQDAVVRLEGLAMSGDSRISLKAIQHQIGSSVNLIVQVSRFSDGSRRVHSIYEVLGVNKDESYNLEPIFELGHLKRTPDGRLHGHLKPTGYIPSFMEEIEANSLPFSRAQFQVPKAA